MSESTLSKPRSRRSVLDLLFRVGVLGWLASALYPVVRYLTPLPLAGPTGPVRLTRDEVSKVERQKFAIIPIGRDRVLVLEDAAGELHALDAKCTHEGCTVRYQPENAINLVRVPRRPLRSRGSRAGRAPAPIQWRLLRSPLRVVRGRPRPPSTPVSRSEPAPLRSRCIGSTVLVRARARASLVA
jgi:Rieske Fe-S protein